MGWVVLSSNSIWGRSFFYLKRPDSVWGPTSLLYNGFRGSSPGVEWPRRDVDDSPPTSSEVKIDWSYTYPPPISDHGEDRDNNFFTVHGVIQDTQNVIETPRKKYAFWIAHPV
jgi:hypothetical protein